MENQQKCKECGNEFELEQGEIDFFNSRGLAMPKRCKDCRDKRRARENSPFAQAKEHFNDRRSDKRDRRQSKPWRGR